MLKSNDFSANFLLFWVASVERKDVWINGSPIEKAQHQCSVNLNNGRWERLFWKRKFVYKIRKKFGLQLHEGCQQQGLYIICSQPCLLVRWEKQCYLPHSILSFLSMSSLSFSRHQTYWDLNMISEYPARVRMCWYNSTPNHRGTLL